MKFKLQAKFKPTGDQPQAIAKLVKGVKQNLRYQTLLGVTGSGKTFTMANVIAKLQRPTLIISHNKTLAAQLASEFQDFFPHNAVHYFVSYYDYYQPEAYLPTTDTYIAKETQLNEEIDRLRHAATTALMMRRDVIIVASVSCIYGLGNPSDYQETKLTLKTGNRYSRKELLTKLNEMRYSRNDLENKRNTYSVKGEIIEIYPSFALNKFWRLTFWGNKLEKIEEVDWLSRRVINSFSQIEIYPATHYLAPTHKIDSIIKQIKRELGERLKELKKQDKLLEAQRLKQRVNYDLEMIKATGYCNGIENYSRYFDGRQAGDPPYTLIDYFPQDFLMFIDESHMTIPQIRAMYAGDRSRKETLVEFGFRLPSALDNRPLTFAEFEQRINQVIFVSATPAEYEKEKSEQTVEQLIRPTGLLDPEVEVRPTAGQIDNLIAEINKRVKKNQRVLVTTLTKKLAEDLTDYLKELNIKAAYLHSEIDTLDRLDILTALRQGKYDVVIGINLLREGLDLPEVSLVAILDADQEGFLRSATTLIQTIGRAARHAEGKVIMYADKVTEAMRQAIDETNRRRQIQLAYNQKHNITPRSIQKEIKQQALAGLTPKEKKDKINLKQIPPDKLPLLIDELNKQMQLAAQNLEFEKAAQLRDQINELKKKIKN